MDRIKRNERMSAMLRILTETPNRIYTLGEFCELFGAAKSTLSEDIDLLSRTCAAFDLGRLETVAGAAGGVRFRGVPGHLRASQALERIAERLREPGRRLPGGFLYTMDITSEPDACQVAGEILAARYYDAQPDFVLTMETKGIPLALMTARALDVPLVIARRDSPAYEGASVKINYIGGGERIETMALARRAVSAGQKALIVDDFMKGGGTLRGMADLMSEFQVEVVGIGVMIATAEPERKRVDDASALMVLEGFEEDRAIVRVNEAMLPV